MLARALVFERAYTPHPVRKRLFQKVGLALPDTDAGRRVYTMIEEKRASIRALHASGDELYSLQVNMQPLPIAVIRECRDRHNQLVAVLKDREAVCAHLNRPPEESKWFWQK